MAYVNWGTLDDPDWELQANPTAIEAEYRTLCEACDEDILPGDRIVEEDGEWIHESCATA